MAEAAYRVDPWRLAAYGELETLKKCKLESGIKIDEKDNKGFTPLIWAARNANANELTWLIDTGCDIGAASFGGLSSLHHACNKNNSAEIKILIKAKADLNQVDDNGDAPLHFAAARGVLNHVVWLLEGGAAPDMVNSQGMTPAMKASIQGHLVIVKKLSEMPGVDLNRVNKEGATCLHLATALMHAPVVAFLLSLPDRLDRSVQNKDGKTAQDFAIKGKNPKIVALFSKANAH